MIEKQESPQEINTCMLFKSAEQRKPGTVKINSVSPPNMLSEFLKAVPTVSTLAENSSVEQKAERALSRVLRTTSETALLKCF